MISEKPWAIDSVMRLFLGIIATYCFWGLLISLLDHATLWPKTERDFLQMLAGTLLLQISALVWLRFFLRQYAVGWKEAFGLESSEAASATAYGILAGALFVPLALGLQWLSGCVMEWAHRTPEAQAAVQALQDPTLSVREKAAFGASAIVLAPLVEESLFRGILYPAIKQLGYPRLALWGTSVLFAALHVNEPTFVPLLVFGLVLARLYEGFGNLLAPIVAHSFFNAANFAVLMFQDQIEHAVHLP